MASFAALRNEAYDRASRREYARTFGGMTALERHKKLLHDLQSYGHEGAAAAAAAADGGAAAALAHTRTDADVLRAGHRFLRTAEDDAGGGVEVRLARRYYDRLFREYALADLSQYQTGRVGLRWRTRAEVVAGKGQFVCGAKGCDEARGLASFEVNFNYTESGQAKAALVKLRLCPACAHKLNWRKEQKATAAAARRSKRRRERKRERGSRRSSGGGSSSSGSSSNTGSDTGSDSGGEGRRRRRGARERSRSPRARGASARAEPAGPSSAARGMSRNVGGGGRRGEGRGASEGAGGGADAEFDALMEAVFREAEG